VRLAVLGVLLGFLLVAAPWRLLKLGFLVVVLPTHTQVHMPGGNDDYWRVMELEANLLARGWPVKYVPMPPRWYGKTCNGPELFGPCMGETDRVLLINESLSWNDRLETLAHEAGHTFEPYGVNFNKGQQEMFAEAVAVLVTGRYRESAHYLAAYRADVLTLLILQGDIYHAVGELTR
jgi:hypothetical protein